jgi:hypothetical protein
MHEIKFRMWDPTMGKYFGLQQSMNCLTQTVTGLYDHTKLHGDVFEQFTGLYDATKE